MLKNILWGTTIAVVAGAGLLLTPAMSDAQNRGGRSGGSSWSGSNGRGDSNQRNGISVGIYPGVGFYPGMGIYPGYYGVGANGYYGTDGRYYRGDRYAPQGYGPAQPTYQSFYPPDTDTNQSYAEVPRAPASDPSAAAFMVRVPDANAEVWFQNHKTQQQGTVRRYESAGLNPNQIYTFHLRATWTQNGRAMDQSRDVQVRAGQQVTVDFSGPAQENVPAAPAAQPPGNIPNVPETPAAPAPRSIQPSR